MSDWSLLESGEGLDDGSEEDLVSAWCCLGVKCQDQLHHSRLQPAGWLSDQSNKIGIFFFVVQILRIVKAKNKAQYKVTNMGQIKFY